MNLSPRAIQIRNLAIAVLNGAITYIILIIAPLGIMAVIINTVLVTLASYFSAVAVDRIILFIQGGKPRQAIDLSDRTPSALEEKRPDHLDRR